MTKKILLGLLLQAVSAMAFADVDISCNQGDCFTYGWEIYDWGTGDVIGVDCRRGDCLNFGWVSTYRGRAVEDTVCKPNGCFSEGWRTYDARTGQLTSDTTCLSSFSSADCLTIGWTTSVRGRASSTFRCSDGDCRNVGWDVAYPLRPLARCKPGGCFNEGWTVYSN